MGKKEPFGSVVLRSLLKPNDQHSNWWTNEQAEGRTDTKTDKRKDEQADRQTDRRT